MDVKLGLSHTKGKKNGVSDNGMIRKIFGPKREDGAGDWRRLHNEELHNFTLHQIL
jgi:hypothetical protein